MAPMCATELWITVTICIRRYVLHLEGVTSSSRLGKLLLMNSVVLKQRGQWIEWYYR